MIFDGRYPCPFSYKYFFNIRFFFSLFVVLLSQNRTKRAAASKQLCCLYRFIFIDDIDDKAISTSYKSKQCSTAEKSPTGRFFWQVHIVCLSRGIFSFKIPLCFNPTLGLKHSPQNAPDDKGFSPSAEGDQRRCLWKPPPFIKGGRKFSFAFGARESSPDLPHPTPKKALP